MIRKRYAQLDAVYTYDSEAAPIEGFRGDHFFLSNFYVHPVKYAAGVTFKSSEHGYMWHKSENADYRNAVMQAATPIDAKRLGYKAKLRDGWDAKLKFQVMYKVLRAKFRDPELRAWLLATGDRYLEETNSHGDRIWGRCGGTGSNHLGRILMVIRYEIQMENSA